MNLLVIGGSDAGISAALRARELDRTATITVLLADSFPNYSICGLDLDLSYTPPLGSPWDAIQMSAQAWSRAGAQGQSAQEWAHA